MTEPMTPRDELAREIFVADNSRMGKEAAEAEWSQWIEGGVDPKQAYCYEIADSLLADGWRKDPCQQNHWVPAPTEGHDW